MTAIEQTGDVADGSPHPLLRGASPQAVRDHLFPEDRDRFVAEYRAALDDARVSLDLTVVHDLVEHWRVLAALQSDPEGFRRAVRRAAQLVSGVVPPENEPFATTRVTAGM